MRPRGPAESYDAVADEYSRRIFGELKQKPFDRALLDRFAARVRQDGTVADVGCGPGHVARYLHGRGVRVLGLDLSAGMVEQAGRLNPEISFIRGDMQALPASDGAWAGLVAFYAVIHLPPGEVVGTLREFARVLEAGAPLLLAFHVGDGVVHLGEWWGRAVSVDFYFFEPAQMQAWLAAAGFDVVEVLERAPYGEDVEHQSRRCYIEARKAVAQRPEPA